MSNLIAIQQHCTAVFSLVWRPLHLTWQGRKTIGYGVVILVISNVFKINVVLYEVLMWPGPERKVPD